MSDIGLPDMTSFLIFLAFAAIIFITALVLLIAGYARRRKKMKTAGWLCLVTAAAILFFITR